MNSGPSVSIRAGWAQFAIHKHWNGLLIDSLTVVGFQFDFRMHHRGRHPCHHRFCHQRIYRCLVLQNILLACRVRQCRSLCRRQAWSRSRVVSGRETILSRRILGNKISFTTFLFWNSLFSVIACRPLMFMVCRTSTNVGQLYSSRQWGLEVDIFC